MEYDVVIGIEIHLELLTNTKMFSSAPYVFKADANTCTNEIDLAHPGTLPSLNKEAVRKALMICNALNLEIDPLIRFDRKNYYYSDLPKGYQITQQFHPIGKNGYIEIYLNNEFKKIRINRAHMEEDTAKQFHLSNTTLIDYNRAGVPLMEIVSEADITSPIEAQLYVDKLRQTFDYLGVSDVKMEEGSLRCDINISLKEKGSNVLGTKVEIKNLNSISNIKDALEYEIQRQKELLDNNQKVSQETRRFDEESGTTVLMRKKEGNVDYKYFPEPNIFPIRLSNELLNEIKDNMPELPDEKTKRYINEYKLNEYDVKILLQNKSLCFMFDRIVKKVNNPKLLCNILSSELVGLLTKHNLNIDNCNINEDNIGKLVNLIDDGSLSSKQGKQVLELLIDNDDIDKIINEKGFVQDSDIDTISKLIEEVLYENEQSIIDYKNGKDRALSYLIGQIMKKSKGKVNPKLTSDLLIKELSKR